MPLTRTGSLFFNNPYPRGEGDQRKPTARSLRTPSRRSRAFSANRWQLKIIRWLSTRLLFVGCYYLSPCRGLRDSRLFLF